ncbi:MFS transporter [Propionibacteriaceae bacterium G57]|uniref:MFS transporter n=1 Tax=Aestuariimicrobium sp. G57 TaxID=3418485 RepID=UPI003DA6F6D7
MSSTFASLAVPNYRKFFIGATVSNIGQWMSRTAASWLVLVDLTDGNARALGWVTSLNFAPALLLAPLAGVVADRFPKRHVMNVAQVVLAIDAAILAALVLTGRAELWHVYVLALMDGIAAAFDGPARQAMASELVGKELLPNAISLNSASFNMARLVGPGVAGFMIAAFDTGPVLAFNVLTFVVLIISLLAIDPTKMHTVKVKRGQGGMVQGIRYISRRFDLVVLLVIAFMMGAFGFNFAISNAVMATEAFGKGAGEYGMVGSWMGVGALVAALVSARRDRPRMRYVLLALGGFGVLMLVSGLTPTYALFAASMVPIGFFAVTVLISANALVQTSVSPEMRGRVMSVWGAVILGGTPLVSPVVGWLGDAIGPRWTVIGPAIPVIITFVVVSLWIMRHDHMRLRFDPSRPAPWLRLVHGKVTEDMPHPIR